SSRAATTPRSKFRAVPMRTTTRSQGRREGVPPRQVGWTGSRVCLARIPEVAVKQRRAPMRPNFQGTAAERTNRRRLLVFLGTLTIALVISLAFTWLRPPEYRATARLEITPAVGGVSSGPAPTNAPESPRSFLTEV